MEGPYARNTRRESPPPWSCGHHKTFFLGTETDTSSLTLGVDPRFGVRTLVLELEPKTGSCTSPHLFCPFETLSHVECTSLLRCSRPPYKVEPRFPLFPSPLTKNKLILGEVTFPLDE